MSAGDFLYNLGSLIDHQFGSGENKLKTLDLVKDGKTTPYGKLGTFATKFDRSAERRYVVDGFYRHDAFNRSPRTLDILMQEPDATVLIKKRAFCSLAENFRPDLMDEKERLLYKATKILFQNKAKQISAYERLCKIEKVSSALQSIDSTLLPFIIDAVDVLSNVALNNNGVGQDALSNPNSGFSKLKGAIGAIRHVVNLSADNTYTTWISDLNKISGTEFGEGTGVLELTNFTNFSTTTSIDFAAGSCQLNIEDPYRLMVVTNSDIEKAINDSTNKTYNNNFFQFGNKVLEEIVRDDKIQLNQDRARRGANPIKFIVNEDTFLGKRVRVLIDNIGFEINFDYSSFTHSRNSSNGEITIGIPGLSSLNNTNDQTQIDPAALVNSEELGPDGITSNEEILIKSIIKNIYTLIQQQTNSQSRVKQNNQETNYVRKRLRLMYGNKPVINPMDSIHIYIRSKTKVDQKIIGGLKGLMGRNSFMQAFNNASANLEIAASSLKDFFNVGNSSSLEKSIFVGNDFPNFLWSILRNQFISDKNGIHVFAGVVGASERSFSAQQGKYTVNIRAKDNASYLSMGFLNIKPAVERSLDSLYEPLTPFDLKFDTVSGIPKNDFPDLLPENKAILASTFSKNNQGKYLGLKSNSKNLSDVYIAPDKNIKNVFYDVDGFAYRWKEGIGTFTFNGNSFYNRPANRISDPALNDGSGGPFAGQDAMNILSLFICGQPYNFATFFKAAAEFDQGVFSRNSIDGQDPANTFLQTLQQDLKRLLFLYGNFVPFKTLTVDEEEYRRSLQTQFTITAANSELSSLIQERANLLDKIARISGLTSGRALASDPNDANIRRVSELNSLIKTQTDAIKGELASGNSKISLVGNDVTFESDTFLNTSPRGALSNENVRKELRRKINFLTRRLIWKVRANEDINLFIVDDSYDKDYDIQTFEKSFTSDLSAFKSDYTDIAEYVNRIKNFLYLEVYADTQGHIRARGPQYNKVPSSVFFNMLRLKHENGIQIFPQFIEDLYSTQISSLSGKLEVIEQEIRLQAALLGRINDEDITNYINSNNSSEIKSLGGPFQFITTFNGTTRGGSLIGSEFTKLLIMSEPDQVQQSKDTRLTQFKNNSFLNTLSQQNRISVFNILNRNEIEQNSFKLAGPEEGRQTLILNNNQAALSTNTNDIKERIYQLKKDISLRTGQQLDPSDTLEINPLNNSSLFAINAELASLISKRQLVIKSLTKSFNSLREGLELETNGKTQKSLMYPNLYKNNNIPESFENLIEDESYDDLGPGSGQRYVIKPNQIISFSLSENPPEISAISVSGSGTDNFKTDAESSLDFFGQGGNALSQANAVDYDMWRMYGIKMSKNISAHFLSDSETQCAPYAVSLLLKARAGILRATASIVGNEYMQPGEVVYIEDEDLLFYIKDVNHDFSFGNNFTTTLTLEYGHNPGEYIPSPLDLIGKTLYRNSKVADIVNYKNNNNLNQQHIGCVALNASSLTTAPESITNGASANNNKQVLNKLLYTAANVLSNTNSNYKPYVSLRIYHDSSKDYLKNVNAYTREAIDSIIDYLAGKPILFPENSSGQSTNKEKLFSLPPDQLKSIKIDIIDAANQNEYRSPSKQAYSLAKTLTNSSPYIFDPFLNISDAISGDSQSRKIDIALHGYIIDCWIVFNQQDPVNNSK